MPMQLFRGVGVVPDVNHDALPLGKAQQRPRKLPIIDLGRDRCVRTKFDQTRADADCIVCRSLQVGSRGRRLGSWAVGLFWGWGPKRGGKVAGKAGPPTEPKHWTSF